MLLSIGVLRPPAGAQKVLRSQGDAEARRSNLDLALSRYQKCLTIQLKTLGREAWELFETKRKIEEVMDGLARRGARKDLEISFHRMKESGHLESLF